MKITSVLYVDAIEPLLPFWVDRLGFEKTVDVPDEGRLGFAILQQGSAEVMLQTHASARKDPSHASLGEMHPFRTFLFIEVEDFEDIRRRLAGTEVLVPERISFYGMREIVVREPGGHFLCFAAAAGDGA